MFVGNQDGKFYALDQGIGSTYWVFTAGGSIQSSALSGWDGPVFFGSSDGNFYNFSYTGTNIWVQTNLGAIVSSPVLGENGMLYFGSANSNLYAMHVPTVLSRYSWPAFRGNLRRTGNEASLLLRPESATVSNVILQISGMYGLTNVIQTSTNLSTWSSIGTNSITDAHGTAFFTNACSNCFYRAKSLDGTIMSMNSLGFLNVYAPTGYSMIANQLNSPAGNVVANLIPSPPSGTYIFKWNDSTQAYITNHFSFGSWTDPNMTLNPGEGVFFYNPTNVTLTLTFIGEVPQGYLLNAFPTNSSIRSSIAPQSGYIDSVLGFPAVDGDAISVYRNGQYSTYTFDALIPPGSWNPTNPVPNLGESFWIRNSTGSSRNWTRNFSVWP